MSGHAMWLGILLGAAVLISFLCAVGVWVMRDAYQRLNFPAGVVSLAALLITVAVFLDDGDPGTRIKTVLIVLVLFFTNGVLGHITARAIRIKQVGGWAVKPEENIPLYGTEHAVGTAAAKKVIP